MGQRLTGMTLAEHWNGRNWSAQTTKHLGALDGVSCPATGNCTAVGSNSAGKALAAHWNGKTWSDQSVASPQQLNAAGERVLHGSDGLLAVGSAGTVSGRRFPGSSRRAVDRQGWTVLTVPDPAPATDYRGVQLSVVHLGHELLGRGDYINPAGTGDATLADQWNGTAWTILTTPSPATFSALYRCPARLRPTASRWAKPQPTGNLSPITEVWNGSTWSLETAAG